MSKIKKYLLVLLCIFVVTATAVFLWIIFPEPKEFWYRVYTPTFKLTESVLTTIPKSEKLYQGIECGGFIANENCRVIIIYTTKLKQEEIINELTNNNQIKLVKNKPWDIDGFSFISMLDIDTPMELTVNGETNALTIRNSNQEPRAFEFRNAIFMDRNINITYIETDNLKLDLDGKKVEGNILKVGLLLFRQQL